MENKNAGAEVECVRARASAGWALRNRAGCRMVRVVVPVVAHLRAWFPYMTLSPEGNEVLRFHGSEERNIAQIILQGFAERLTSSQTSTPFPASPRPSEAGPHVPASLGKRGLRLLLRGQGVRDRRKGRGRELSRNALGMKRVLLEWRARPNG